MRISNKIFNIFIILYNICILMYLWFQPKIHSYTVNFWLITILTVLAVVVIGISLLKGWKDET